MTFSTKHLTDIMRYTNLQYYNNKIFFIPITISNPLKKKFRLRNIYHNTIQTHPTQIVKVSFLIKKTSF